jgi:hypothetical protein
MSHEKKTVEMTGRWKAWKTNRRFSTLPTAPWKSLRDSHIPTAPATNPVYFSRQSRMAAGLRPWPVSYRVVVVDREK